MSSVRDKVKSFESGGRCVVDAWGTKVEVRSMTLRQKLALAETGEDPAKIVPRMLVSCVYDPESGEPVFTEDDADWLLDQDSAEVERVAEAVQRVSGLLEDEAKEGKGGSSSTTSGATS